VERTAAIPHASANLLQGNHWRDCSLGGGRDTGLFIVRSHSRKRYGTVDGVTYKRLGCWDYEKIFKAEAQRLFSLRVLMPEGESTFSAFYNIVPERDD
jgi:hypothetical protein